MFSRASAATSDRSGSSSEYAAQAKRKSCQVEQAELVAELVERVGLVDAAAPDADQVQAGRPRLLQSLAVARTVDPHREGVVGDPVRALHEHRLVVHDELERGAVGVGLRVPAQVAEADPSGRLVEHPAVGAEPHADVVEHGVAIADGPPALHLLEFESHDGLVRSRRDHRRGARARDLEIQAQLGVIDRARGIRSLHRDDRLDDAARTRRRRAHEHLLEPGRRP